MMDISSRMPLQELHYRRWVRANVAIASLFSVGLLALALMGSSGAKYQAAGKPTASMAANTHPKPHHSDLEVTGSINPARARIRSR